MKFLFCIYIFSIIFSLERLSAQGKDMFYIVSRLDLTDKSFPSRVNNIPVDTMNVSENALVLMGIGIYERDDYDEIADNISDIKQEFDKIYVIPGAYDWDMVGSRGIEGLDDYLDEEFDQDILIPDNACGELETKEVGKDGVVAALDSKWLLQNWDKDNYINKGCYTRDRRRFWLLFSDELSGHKDRIVLLFTYHPPLRYDKASGHYPLLSHLLPAPILGTAKTLLKTYSGGIDSPMHPVYREYSSKLVSAMELEPNVISVSAQGNYQMDHYCKDGYFVNVNSYRADDYINKNRVSWSSNKQAYLKVYLDNRHIHSEWFDINTHQRLYSRVLDIDREIRDTTTVKESERPGLNNTHTASIIERGEIPQPDNFLFGELNTEA